VPAVVVATAFGGPEVLSVIDEPTRAPGADEVVIDVRAAATNPADVKAYTGVFGKDESKLPMRLGYEAAGIVREVGADVRDLAPSDEVIAFRVTGGYAEQLVVPRTALTRKPATLDWPAAAGLMLTGATAVHTLAAVELQPGETVVLHGAGGGVGLMAIQLAANAGAHVIATASPGKHELLRELGATPVAYGDGLVERIRAAAPQGVAAAVDLVGTDEAVDASLELVSDRTRIASIAAFGRAVQDDIKLLGGGPGADPGTELRDAARQQLADLAADGRIRVIVDSTYPLRAVAEAHAKLRDGHASGKIILTV
jgi:NADPH:quinone reductase-like Zn-dependent oxidoreductase